MIGYRWAEGWEPYGGIIANASSNWTIGASFTSFVSSALGNPVRTGDWSFRLRSGLGGGRRVLGGDFDRVGFAMGFQMSRLPERTGGSTVIQQFRNSDARSHMSITISPTGRIRLLGIGYDRLSATTETVLAESTLELTTGVFYFIDTILVLDPVSGSCIVNVNGDEYVRFEGNTVRAPSGNAYCAEFAFGNFDGSKGGTWGAGGDLYYDDIIARALAPADGGSIDFLPICGVYWLVPDADGDVEQWELTSGTNSFALVNEIPPDEDVGYLFTSNTNDRTSVEVEALPINVIDVLAVTAVARARKDDSGTARIDVGLRIGTTDYLLGDTSILTNYAQYERNFVLNPDTAAAWDPLALPDLLIKRTA